MPLYLIKVRERGRLLSDNGHTDEFGDLEAARTHVVEGARQALSDTVRKGKAASFDAEIQIQDQHGQTLLVVPCGRVVGTPTQS
jgi:hypothetical protein